jgi:hypothetical protein
MENGDMDIDMDFDLGPIEDDIPQPVGFANEIDRDYF